MITLRLDPKLEKDVNIAAENLGLSKSELIRLSINDYLGKMKQPDAWEAGEQLFGKYSSGLGNLSADRKELLKSKVAAKRK
ncbi:MAG: ribbon-helix-helix domain-containing protein [Proteobacteria bacterium]|nr:ribbon-helix-helix domain-containing protein [Pseudomonadota bacterium]MBU1738131.1 ribbon-helix-helix domain-containing protein [Pseudomonadota bacterium]